MAKSKSEPEKNLSCCVQRHVIPSEVLLKGLPSGAKILQADFDSATGDLKVVVQHESFDEWDPTEAMPEVDSGHKDKKTH
jgi:hypothetical protein